MAAEAAGASVGTGDLVHAEPGASPGALRLALGYEADRDRLLRGLGIVADLLERDGGRQTLPVRRRLTERPPPMAPLVKAALPRRSS